MAYASFLNMYKDITKHPSLQGRVRKSSECWTWEGCSDKDGYGVVSWEGKRWRAHRLAFLLSRGSLDESLMVLHGCDNPPCVRPSHLRQGDAFDNVADARKRGRLCCGDRHPTRRHPETVRGENNGRAVLTHNDILKIRRFYKRGDSTIEIAKRFKITNVMVSRIATGKAWRHVGGPIGKRGQGYRRRFNEEKRQLIIEAHEAGVRIKRIMERFGVSDSHIWNIVYRDRGRIAQ